MRRMSRTWDCKVDGVLGIWDRLRFEPGKSGVGGVGLDAFLDWLSFMLLAVFSCFFLSFCFCLFEKK